MQERLEDLDFSDNICLRVSRAENVRYESGSRKGRPETTQEKQAKDQPVSITEISDVEGKELEQVVEFYYLGSTVSSSGRNGCGHAQVD